MIKKFFPHDLIALIIYFILTLAITFPLILHFQTSIIGLPGDPFFNLWGIWWDKYSATHHLDAAKFFFLNAPTGIFNAPAAVFSPLGVLTKTIAFIFNETIAFNSVIFLNLVLSAWSFYFLIKFLIRKYWLAVVAGASWGFSPYALAHTQHLSLSALWLLPFFLLALFKMIEEKRSLYLFLTALVFILISVIDFYYLFFAIILLLLYFFYCLLYRLFRQQWITLFLDLKFFFFFFIIAFPLVAMVNFKLLRPFVIDDQKSLLVQVSERPVKELFTYTAKGRDYFFPPPSNFFWGGLTAGYIREGLNGSNLSEQTLYLGIVPLAIALVICLFAFTGLIKTRSRFYIFFFVFLAMIAFILSFSSNITLWDKEIKTPSYYFYLWGLNMFRVYARFGVLVLLAVLALFAYGLEEISLRSPQRRIALIIFLLLTFTEFFNFPLPTTDVASVPLVYQWLKTQEGDFIIAEYPFERSDYVRQSQYQLYQRFHQKRILNGAPLGSKEEELRQKLIYLDNPETWEKLKEIGVKYVFVHQDYYREGKIPAVLQDYYSPEIEKIIPYQTQDHYLYEHQTPKINFSEDKVQKIGEWQEIAVYQID